MIVFAQASDRSPDVILHDTTLTISGRSFMSNAVDFYKRIIVEIDSIQTPEFTVDMSLEHFNSASSKCILQLFRVAEKKLFGGSKVKIIWRYKSNYAEMIEAGEDYRDLLDSRVDFEFVEMPD